MQSSSFDLDAYRSDRHDRAVLRLCALLYITNQVDTACCGASCLSVRLVCR